MKQFNKFPARMWHYWRVVFWLAAKDIVDAIKNKTTLTIVIGLGTIMLSVEALPLLLQLDKRPYLALYDGARSGLADTLRQEGTLQVRELRRAEDAITIVQESSQPLLSLALPSGWETSEEALLLDGYVTHWAAQEENAALTTTVAATISAVTGRGVEIQPQIVYPTLQNEGHTIMVALGLIMATILITTILVPYLILEEKSARTLDLLRVSPVNVSQVLAGKGLAGMVYGITAVAIFLAFNLSMVTQWSLLLVTLMGIILFGVGLGLLVGTAIENEGGVQLWVGTITIVLMFPLMLGFIDSSRIPTWLKASMDWLPSTAAFELVRLSFTQQSMGGEEWSHMAAIGGAVLIVYLIAAWRLQSWER